MITIVEPFLGVLVSNIAKRAVGQTWDWAQTVRMLLELLVDYIILIFLVFMATTHKTDTLEIDFFGHSTQMSKGGWSLVFLLCVIVSALCWKQGVKQIFATVNFKSSPNWLKCLLWNVPNLLMVLLLTSFLFGVVAI